MSVVRVIASNNSGANLSYILDDKVHSDKLVHHRVLASTGQNVGLDYNNRYNSRYLAMQYQAVRELAEKQSKAVQCQHLIFSFSKSEFNPKDETEAKSDGSLALQIVNDFMKNRFGKTAQYVAVAQDDAEGGNLHVHVSVNSVCLDGRSLNTNLVSVKDRKKVATPSIRTAFDNYMSDVFEDLTGRKFVPVKPKDNGVLHSANVAKAEYNWKDELIEKIKAAIDLCRSVEDLKNQLKSDGVTVKEHSRTCGRDANGKKLKRKGWTYYFVDSHGKHQRVRDFMYGKNGKKTGLGLNYTPDAFKEHYEELKKQQQQKEDALTSSLDAEADDLMASLNASVEQTEAEISKEKKGVELTQQPQQLQQDEQQAYNRKRQTRERQETQEDTQQQIKKVGKRGHHMDAKSLSRISRSDGSRHMPLQQSSSEKEEGDDLAR